MEETSAPTPSSIRTRLSDIFSSAREYSGEGSLYYGVKDVLGYVAQKYGDENLFLGPPEAQIGGSSFDLPGLIRVTDLASAKEALQGIVIQGERARGENKDSHYETFVGIQEEYEQLLRDDPTFEPGRLVLWNPYSMLPGDLVYDSAVSLIEDPLSIDISNLFDGCYELMMRMLARMFLHGEESQREQARLADITVSIMTDVLGPRGEALTTLPAGPSHPGLTAGPSFRFSREINTPPRRDAAWTLFIERLKELSAYSGFLQSERDVSSLLVRVRRSLAQYADQLDSVRQQQ